MKTIELKVEAAKVEADPYKIALDMSYVVSDAVEIINVSFTIKTIHKPKFRKGRRKNVKRDKRMHTVMY
jgi:hypothetical protein